MSDQSNTLPGQIERSLHGLVSDKDETILVLAYSGGPDSSALLGLLAEWGLKSPGRMIVVAHFNHRLRHEADAEEELARQTAARYGLEFFSDSADVAEYAKINKSALHAAARILRYHFLAKISKQLRQEFPSRSVYIITAHHLDDQIETILMRLFSGSGVEGLAGIRATAPCPGAPGEKLLRPLLGIRKHELVNYCQANEIPYVEDSSNHDTAYPRTAIREKIIPEIVGAFGEGVIGSIARSGELLGMAADKIGMEIDQSFRECLISANRNEIAVDFQAFSSYFCLVRLAIFQRCARLLAGDDNRIPLERYQAADEGVVLDGREVQLGGGIAVQRFRNSVYIYRSFDEWEPFAFSEGVFTIPGQGVVTIDQATASSVALPPPPGILYIDADLCNTDLAFIRSVRAGDRMIPFGSKHPCSLYDLLRDAGIPPQRRNAPVIEIESEIVALLPLRIAHRYRLTENTQHIYRLTMSFPSVEIQDFLGNP